MELAGQAVSEEEVGKGDGLGLGQPGRTLWKTEASRGELCGEETGDRWRGLSRGTRQVECGDC